MVQRLDADLRRHARPGAVGRVVDVAGCGAGRGAGRAFPEGRMSDGAKPGWVRRLLAVLGNHRRDIVLAVVAAILGSACLTVVPLVARQIVDKVVIAQSQPLWPWLTLLIGLGAASFGFAYIRRYHGGPGRARRPVRPAQRDARPPAAARLRDPVAAAHRPAGGPRELRFDPGAGAVELPAVHERQRADDAAVDRRDAVPLAAARAGRPARRAGAAAQLVPDAAADLPGHVGRPAAGGRRRPDRRRGRQRRARGQGLRPGTARARTGGRRGRSGCTARSCGRCGCRPASSRCSRPSRRWPRWRSWPSAAGWPCTARSRWARSWPSRPTWPSSPRRPASSPGCSPSASRPGPGSSGSSSSSTSNRRSPTPTTPSS